MSNEISNSDDVIDSRDVIARIEELSDVAEKRDELKAAIAAAQTPEEKEAAETALELFTETDDGHELSVLEALAAEGETSPDWHHGETLIRHDYFVEYIKELINDCYEMPKDINSGQWPWRHMTLDYEAAAQEAEVDYQEVMFDGVTYLIRA